MRAHCLSSRFVVVDVDVFCWCIEEPRVSAVVTIGHWEWKLSIGRQFWGCEISLELLQLGRKLLQTFICASLVKTLGPLIKFCMILIGVCFGDFLEFIVFNEFALRRWFAASTIYLEVWYTASGASLETYFCSYLHLEVSFGSRYCCIQLLSSWQSFQGQIQGD